MGKKIRAVIGLFGIGQSVGPERKAFGLIVRDEKNDYRGIICDSDDPETVFRRISKLKRGDQIIERHVLDRNFPKDKFVRRVECLKSKQRREKRRK